MPDDSKNTGEQWPQIWHFRHRDDGRAAGYTSEPHLAASNIFYDIERYLPLHSIRERLLETLSESSHVATEVERVRRAVDFETLDESVQMLFEAALQAAFPKEESEC